jgi:hypothetical protein
VGHKKLETVVWINAKDRRVSHLKEIAHWDEQYLLSLPPGEFDWLEYKSSPWLSLDPSCLESISKYCSAFSNFEGGYLIIGLADPDGQSSPTIESGGVDLTIKPDLKSWLEDKVPNLVDPPLSQLGVAIIGPDGPSSSILPGRGVIVFHVPSSVGAPHQARDKKFYTRLGSKLAPLNTRAVIDISERRRLPSVETRLKLNWGLPDRSNLHWKVINTSDVFVRHVAVRIRFPVECRGSNIYFEGGTLDEEDGAHFWTLTTSNNAGTPLFPGGGILTNTFPLRYDVRFTDIEIEKTIEKISVQIFADSMPRHDEEFDLAQITNHNRLPGGDSAR